MKTQIIQLDPHDDYLSVRDKIGWSQAGRILLVWPDERRLLTRRLDVALIQRYCAASGALLALVSQNHEVQADAALLGIPVFEDVREALKARWRSGRRRRARARRREPRPDLYALRDEAHPKPPAWLTHPAVRFGAFIIAVIALSALAAFLLPAAHISLTPVTQPQQITLPIKASQTIQLVNLVGELPARPASVMVEGRGSQPATGSIQIPLTSATGSIRFVNLTEQAVDVPQGSIVSTLGEAPVRFATTRAGQVPAGIDKSTSLPVQALVPGSSSNCAQDTLVAIEGDLGLSLSVTNPYAIRDGADGSAASPSEKDRQKLFEQLTASLQQSALTELHTDLSPGDLVLTPTLKYVRTIQVDYTPSSGLPGENLNLTLQVEFQTLIISGEDIQALVTPVLNAGLPSGFQPASDLLTVTPAGQPRLNADSSISWALTARRNLQAVIPSADAVQLIVGIPISQASQRLMAALPISKPPQISLNPAWWPRLPFLPFRITISTP